ncbi:MAG TPA: hypothetical protein V6D06_11890, partial [Trichocoleus sp.]
GHIQSLGAENPILRLAMAQGKGWLMLPKLTLEVQRHLAKAGSVLASEVLWWDGSPLAEELVAAVGPRVAIASTTQLNPKTEAQLQARQIQVFVTERDGAILWTAKSGFEAYLHSQHRRQGDLDSAG